MAEQHDDLCIICAHPLEFTAFGSCGHKDICSKCVARMRFVMKDKGCVFCRQENAQVFFTRFMGDYTTRVAPEEFDGLQARLQRRELYSLPEINGYFDDERHCQEIRALCSFTHPIMESSAGRGAPKFTNFNALKRHVETTYNQFFCDVCVKSRKVFISEQQLYNKEALRRHQETGDESGPMAVSGFKGHPLCRFCRTRFYDSNELYRHMESSHENCFLCRRAEPGKYVYYRHYKELEDHFTKEHHPCPHPACLERKFVVFSTEYELKAHFASEHGDEVKMTAAQRRQALTIPLQLQFRSRDDEDTEPGASAHLERAAVIIGGGHNIGSRAARGGRGGARASGMHHSRSEPQIAQEAGPEVSSITFTAEDFPAPTSSQQSAAGPLGQWAAFAGAQASAGGLSEQDFPALPTMSRNQRRRIKEQQRTLADRLSAAAQPPRVLNRAAPAPTSGSAGAGAGPSSASSAASALSQAVPAANDFPALRTSVPASPTPSSFTPTPAPAPQPTTSSFSGARAADVVAPVSANRRPPGFGREEFPALGGGVKARPAPPPSPPALSAYSGAAAGLSSASNAPTGGLSQTEVLNSFFMRPGSAAATVDPPPAAVPTNGTAAGAAPESSPQLSADDFPSLPGGGKHGAAKVRAGGFAKAQATKASTIKVIAAPAAVERSSAVPSSTGASGGGVSDSLKAANKALVERIKRQLSGAAFDTFRQQSLLFMRGELQAEEYHDYMVSLGLLSLVAELVSLCPDASKRRLLLDVHCTFICSPAAQDPALVGAGWMPPEAAVAKADRVAQHSSWGCPRCGLCNAPDDARCEACGALRPAGEAPMPATASAGTATQPSVPSLAARVGSLSVASTAASAAGPSREVQPQLQLRAVPVAEDFPSLVAPTGRRGTAAAASAQAVLGADSDLPVGVEEGSGPQGSSAAAAGGKGKKGKGTTIKIGLPTSGAGSSSSSARVHPQNAWTQPTTKAKVANSWSGQGGGKLAKMHSAMNDAWDF